MFGFYLKKNKIQQKSSKYQITKNVIDKFVFHLVLLLGEDKAGIYKSASAFTTWIFHNNKKMLMDWVKGTAWFRSGEICDQEPAMRLQLIMRPGGEMGIWGEWDTTQSERIFQMKYEPICFAGWERWLSNESVSVWKWRTSGWVEGYGGGPLPGGWLAGCAWGESLSLRGGELWWASWSGEAHTWLPDPTLLPVVLGSILLPRDAAIHCGFSTAVQPQPTNFSPQLLSKTELKKENRKSTAVPFVRVIFNSTIFFDFEK